MTNNPEDTRKVLRMWNHMRKDPKMRKFNTTYPNGSTRVRVFGETVHIENLSDAQTQHLLKRRKQMGVPYPVVWTVNGTKELRSFKMTRSDLLELGREPWTTNIKDIYTIMDMNEILWCTLIDELKDRKLLSKDVTYAGVYLDFRYPKSFDKVA